ncbi:MAG: pantoate--beta-alanine ligase [Bacteroidetes bacterium]|nr:pantoate--beta-alanine ligase [Bacteroidota bacterium]MBL0017795.1 pantoate--beta-alanine ligase [Bacteroidota bacterium]
MQVFDHPFALRTALHAENCLGRTIGFVPTMGALHEGHGALIARSAAENDITVVSIFVNPTQFGPNEDLEKYPRTLEADLALCKSAGATHIFTPTEATMYPDGKGNFEVLMGLRTMDKYMDGAKRPGHFDGVLLVVARLFNIVLPTRAYFGKKDFQQLSILQALARELFFPLTIVPCDIVRDADGLAKSSRNRYLNTEERQQALYLSRCLQALDARARAGMEALPLTTIATEMAAAYPLIRLEYLEIRKSRDLSLVDVLRPEDEPVALIAAFCGNTRLIDNLVLGLGR